MKKKPPGESGIVYLFDCRKKNIKGFVAVCR